MINKGAVYLRLTANPRPQTPWPEQKDIGFIAKGAAYRTSLQVAFWDRQVLLDLLEENESAWDFEINGSRRSDRISEPFLSVCEGISPIHISAHCKARKMAASRYSVFHSAGCCNRYFRTSSGIRV